MIERIYLIGANLPSLVRHYKDSGLNDEELLKEATIDYVSKMLSDEKNQPKFQYLESISFSFCTEDGAIIPF